MKKIIISCPYNGLSKLEKLIRSEIDSGDLLISDRDIEAIDDDYVYLENNEKHLIKSFTKSYIRYPYDLISPHSETYEKRENTEFLKTLAILFNHVAINNFFKAHLSRNRIYSLNIAEKCGFNVPKSLICKKYTNSRTIGKKITKSLGNCFYSEKLNNKKLKDILYFEEDDGEKAYIYKPHLIKKELDFKKHIDNFHTIFLQNEIYGDEFRAYLIGNKIIIYKRNKIESLDQSSAELVKINEHEKEILKKYEDNFLMISKKLDLKYYCLDLIINENDAYVIDLNPYGSYPANQDEVIQELSKLILK